MKKIICILGIFVIIFAQNVLAINNKLINESLEVSDSFFKNKIIRNDPPSWANGEFNGTWGIGLGGIPAVELGWVEGYFDAVGIFGRIEGDFAVWGNEEPTAYIRGIILGYFMLGVVGDYINPDNATFYVGLGAPNENGTFYYNIHLFIGPSWYMEGTWREI